MSQPCLTYCVLLITLHGFAVSMDTETRASDDVKNSTLCSEWKRSREDKILEIPESAPFFSRVLSIFNGGSKKEVEKQLPAESILMKMVDSFKEARCAEFLKPDKMDYQGGCKNTIDYSPFLDRISNLRTALDAAITHVLTSRSIASVRGAQKEITTRVGELETYFYCIYHGQVRTDYYAIFKKMDATFEVTLKSLEDVPLY